MPRPWPPSTLSPHHPAAAHGYAARPPTPLLSLSDCVKGSHRIDRRLTPLGFGQIAASSCPRGASPDTMSDRSSQASPTFFPFGPQAEIRDVTFKVRHPRPKKNLWFPTWFCAI